MLTKANIANRISELQKEATSSEVMTVREQKEILTKIFRTTIADFAEFDKNGLTVRVMPRAPLEGLQEFKNWTKYSKNGMPKVKFASIKLHDKIRAIKQLMKGRI